MQTRLHSRRSASNRKSYHQSSDRKPPHKYTQLTAHDATVSHHHHPLNIMLKGVLTAFAIMLVAIPIPGVHFVAIPLSPFIAVSSAEGHRKSRRDENRMVRNHRRRTNAHTSRHHHRLLAANRRRKTPRRTNPLLGNHRNRHRTIRMVRNNNRRPNLLPNPIPITNLTTPRVSPVHGGNVRQDKGGTTTSFRAKRGISAPFENRRGRTQAKRVCGGMHRADGRGNHSPSSNIIAITVQKPTAQNHLNAKPLSNPHHSPSRKSQKSQFKHPLYLKYAPSP